MDSIRPILNIVLLSLVAGLGTGLGGLLAVLHKPAQRSFGFLMGAAAGVMITLSFHELVHEAWVTAGYLTTTLGFGFGATFMLLIDYFVPHIRFGEKETRREPTSALESNPGDNRGRHRHGRRWRTRGKIEPDLLKTGILLLIGITIHNIPEGIAVGAGFMHTPAFGIFIAGAILLHNIPEGIATALPLYTGGLSKWDSFRAAFLSGLAEPVGALAAALFLGWFRMLVPFSLAFAGGVMVFITLDELIPTARQYGHQHFTAVGIISGAIFVFLLSGVFGV